jgi:hypothetical protein
MKILRLILRSACAVAAAWVASAQQPKRVDDNALKNASKNGDEWLTNGRDYAETHYSPLKQIDTSNVKRLGLAWSWETESPSGARIEATPLRCGESRCCALRWIARDGVKPPDHFAGLTWVFSTADWRPWTRKRAKSTGLFKPLRRMSGTRLRVRLA